MHILIVYDSKTGNTEKMAQKVAEGVREQNLDIIIKRVEDTTNVDLVQANGIIVGSPTYYGQMSGKIKGLFDESVKIHGKLTNKIGGGFTSSGGVATGAETTIISILEAMLIHGMIIQGRANLAHYGAASVGNPDEKEEESCKKLGKMIAELTLKIHSKE